MLIDVSQAGALGLNIGVEEEPSLDVLVQVVACLLTILSEEVLIKIHRCFEEALLVREYQQGIEFGVVAEVGDAATSARVLLVQQSTLFQAYEIEQASRTPAGELIIDATLDERQANHWAFVVVVFHVSVWTLHLAEPRLENVDTSLARPRCQVLLFRICGHL